MPVKLNLLALTTPLGRNRTVWDSNPLEKLRKTILCGRIAVWNCSLPLQEVVVSRRVQVSSLGLWRTSSLGPNPKVNLRVRTAADLCPHNPWSSRKCTPSSCLFVASCDNLCVGWSYSNPGNTREKLNPPCNIYKFICICRILLNCV